MSGIEWSGAGAISVCMSVWHRGTVRADSVSTHHTKPGVTMNKSSTLCLDDTPDKSPLHCSLSIFTTHCNQSEVQPTWTQTDIISKSNNNMLWSLWDTRFIIVSPSTHTQWNGLTSRQLHLLGVLSSTSAWPLYWVPSVSQYKALRSRPLAGSSVMGRVQFSLP